jgi:predicted secreted protein
VWKSADCLGQTEFPSHIRLAAGEERTLPLSSLATAGYRWSASVSGAEPGVVAVELRRGEPAAGGKPGASAPEEAVLRGIRPGHALVRLEQRRPWESDRPPAQAVALQVEVRR